MAKERVKNQVPMKSEKLTRLELMLQVGNVSAARKFSANLLNDPALPEQERKDLLQLLKGIAPEPLVFWIGVGSVAVATALALWLVR